MCALDKIILVSLKFYSLEWFITVDWLLELNIRQCVLQTFDEAIRFCEPVMTESAMSRCIGACFSAHAVKIFTTQVFELRSLRYSNFFSDLMPWFLYWNTENKINLLMRLMNCMLCFLACAYAGSKYYFWVTDNNQLCRSSIILGLVMNLQ